MKKVIGLLLVSVSATMLVASAVQAAPARPLTSIPSDSITVTDWYRQDIYDQNNAKLGQVKDVLLDKSGRATALIVGVGGLLGADETNVAIPFETVQMRAGDNNSMRLILDSTVDALKAGPALTYDRQKTTWVPTTH